MVKVCDSPLFKPRLSWVAGPAVTLLAVTSTTSGGVTPAFWTVMATVLAPGCRTTGEGDWTSGVHVTVQHAHAVDVHGHLIAVNKLRVAVG